MLISRIAERYGGKLYKDYVLVRCPFHADTHPSMIVHEDFFICKSCGARGRTEQLLGMRPKIAGAPAEVPRDLTEHINVKKSVKNLLTTKNGIIEDIFARGFDRSDIYKFEIGYVNGFYSFPTYNFSGELSGAVYRHTKLTLEYQKYIIKSPSRLYIPKVMVDYLKGNSMYLFITFGIVDALTLIKLGYPAVSTMTGKNVSSLNLSWWHGKLFVIPDIGEEKEAKRMALNFGVRASVLSLQAHKDPTEFIERRDADALRQEITSMPMWKKGSEIFL